MAIRKGASETLVVPGSRAEWMTKTTDAMNRAGFSGVTQSITLGQVSGKYQKMTVWGELTVTVTPHSEGFTQLVLQSVANQDNVFALGSSPNGKIMTAFKSQLD